MNGIWKALSVIGLVVIVSFVYLSKDQPEQDTVTSLNPAVSERNRNETSETQLSARQDVVASENLSETATVLEEKSDCFTPTEIVTPTGEMITGLLPCESVNEGESHHYDRYTDETLLGMAVNDNNAKAAEIWGKRNIGLDHKTAYRMLVRAFALTNDFSHLDWLSDQGFGAEKVNGNLNNKVVTSKYVIARTAEIMSEGSPYADEYTSDRVRLEGLLQENNVPPKVMIELERRSWNLHGMIVDIQENSGSLNVVGGQNNG